MTTCAYCAVVLAGHSVGAAATALSSSSSKSASARSLSENKAYLGQYKFDTKTGFGMPVAAEIDQDMKLIVSNLEKNDEAGFAKAHEVVFVAGQRDLAAGQFHVAGDAPEAGQSSFAHFGGGKIRSD